MKQRSIQRIALDFVIANDKTFRVLINKDQYSRRKIDNSQRGRRVPNTANYHKAKMEDVTCYNCDEIGHNRSQCGQFPSGNIVPPEKTDREKAVSLLNVAISE